MSGLTSRAPTGAASRTLSVTVDTASPDSTTPSRRNSAAAPQTDRSPPRPPRRARSPSPAGAPRGTAPSCAKPPAALRMAPRPPRHGPDGWRPRCQVRTPLPPAKRRNPDTPPGGSGRRPRGSDRIMGAGTRHAMSRPTPTCPAPWLASDYRVPTSDLDEATRFSAEQVHGQGVAPASRTLPPLRPSGHRSGVPTPDRGGHRSGRPDTGPVRTASRGLNKACHAPTPGSLSRLPGWQPRYRVLCGRRTPSGRKPIHER